LAAWFTCSTHGSLTLAPSASLFPYIPAIGSPWFFFFSFPPLSIRSPANNRYFPSPFHFTGNTTMSNARGPTATLLGLAAGALAATGWVLYVNHLVDSASAGGDPAYWAGEARHRAYDVCYDGCGDCLDVSVIQNACDMTTQPTLQGKDLICDAALMWTWEDRYPAECLDAVGAIYQDKATERKRFWRRFLYGLVILAVPVALGVRVVAMEALEHASRWQPRRPRIRSNRSQPSSATPLLQTAAAAAAIVSILVTPAAAFPCDEFRPAYDQPFVSVNNASLFGIIHGWLSNCYSEEYSCGENCRSDHTTTSCTTSWCSRRREDKTPRDFVRGALGRVKKCGFKPADFVPGVVDTRIANSRIESRLWVKISVNRLNGTEGVDPQVMCLYSMLGVPSYAGTVTGP